MPGPHQSVVPVNLIDGSVDLSIEYTFVRGFDDYWDGETWNLGRNDQVDITGVSILLTDEGGAITIEPAPAWLVELSESSAYIFEELCAARRREDA